MHYVIIRVTNLNFPPVQGDIMQAAPHWRAFTFSFLPSCLGGCSLKSVTDPIFPPSPCYLILINLPWVCLTKTNFVDRAKLSVPCLWPVAYVGVHDVCGVSGGRNHERWEEDGDLLERETVAEGGRRLLHLPSMPPIASSSFPFTRLLLRQFLKFVDRALYPLP